ncbi:MAG TPA: hypothetical protein VNM45_13385 [Bacillus sp. (in: firmicutes)]|nr:hypothetical protein [Bacillus sp. (in: firmicutes)]
MSLRLAVFFTGAKQSPELEAHGCANEAVATGRCVLRLRSFTVQLRLLAPRATSVSIPKAKSAFVMKPPALVGAKQSPPLFLLSSCGS